MDMPFASLQQLCAPLLDGLAQLPGPQRAAVEAAFGLRTGSGAAPDPFFVSLGVLGLLSEAAKERPVICLVDDVQRLDPASVGAPAVARTAGCRASVLDSGAARAARAAFRTPGVQSPFFQVQGTAGDRVEHVRQVLFGVRCVHRV